MPTTRSLSPIADTSRTALLVVDMISCWDFPDADRLLPAARRIAPVIARLQQQCRRARVPVIFANDNNGRWRSDFRTQVDLALASTAGAAITTELRPLEGDYFILKPKHSALFATPLETWALTTFFPRGCQPTSASSRPWRKPACEGLR